jgi:hypothetical protein
MGNPPRAHRRLVPRVPKKESKEPRLDDLEVTSERVIVIEELSDPEIPPPQMPLGSVDLADESMEMTAVRGQFAVPEAEDDLDEMTLQRLIDTPLPDEPPVEEPDDFDDDDANETSTRMPRDALAHLLAERGVPQFDEAPQPFGSPQFDVNAFSDSEPTSLKAPHSTVDAEDRPTTHISPAERGLLAAMSEGHEASRMVYVKWLEKRGEVVRAEFLKLDCVLAQMSTEDSRYQPTRRRLLELAPRISIDWRSRIARSLIEGCTTTNGRCPGYWRSLPADGDDVRACGECGENVYYCVSIDLARGRRASRQRVAVDLTVERYHGDLEVAMCGSCGQAIPSGGTRFCPHCGRMQG